MTTIDPDKNLAVVDESELVDALAMALVDEVVDGSGSSVTAIVRRLGIAKNRSEEMIAAARMRLAARADFDQALQRADAVTHFREIIRRARRMGAADLADFEPFLTGGKKLADLRAEGLDTTLAKSAKEHIHTNVDDGEVIGVDIRREVVLYSPADAVRLEMNARKELTRLLALYPRSYDHEPPEPDEIIDAEVLTRPRDAAAEVLFDAIDKHIEPLFPNESTNSTYVDAIKQAGKEIKALRRAAKKAERTAQKKKTTKKTAKKGKKHAKK